MCLMVLRGQPRQQGLMPPGRWGVGLFPMQLTRSTMGESV